MSSLYAKRNVAYLSFTDQHGRRQVRSLKLKVKRIGSRVVFPQSALDIQKRVDAEVAMGTFGYRLKVKPILMSEALDRYMETHGSDLAPSTKYQTKMAVGRFIRILGDLPMSQYTTEMLFGFRTELLKGITEQTASFYLRAISPIFTWAKENRYLQESPYVRKLRRKPENPQPMTFRVDQLETVMREVMEVNRDIAIQLRFILLTGCRNTASCMLKWSQVDLDEGVIFGLNLKSRKRQNLLPFPIYKELDVFLRSLPHDWKPYVFRYRERAKLSRAVKTVREKHGYPAKLNVHAIRKYTATYLLKKGLKIELVADILGHSDINVTRNHYAAFTMEDKRRALDEVFNQTQHAKTITVK